MTVRSPLDLNLPSPPSRLPYFPLLLCCPLVGGHLVPAADAKISQVRLLHLTSSRALRRNPLRRADLGPTCRHAFARKR